MYVQLKPTIKGMEIRDSWCMKTNNKPIFPAAVAKMTATHPETGSNFPDLKISEGRNLPHSLPPTVDEALLVESVVVDLHLGADCGMHLQYSCAYPVK